MDTKSIVGSIKDIGLMVLASLSGGFLVILGLMMAYKAQDIANDTALDLPAAGVTQIETFVTTLAGILVALGSLISLATGIAAIVILYSAFFGKKDIMTVGGNKRT